MDLVQHWSQSTTTTHKGSETGQDGTDILAEIPCMCLESTLYGLDKMRVHTGNGFSPAFGLAHPNKGERTVQVEMANMTAAQV